MSLDGVAFANAGELALIPVGEDLAAAMGPRPLFAGLLGVGLGVVGRDDVAVLLFYVPAFVSWDDMDVRHARSLPGRRPGQSLGSAGGDGDVWAGPQSGKRTASRFSDTEGGQQWVTVIAARRVTRPPLPASRDRRWRRRRSRKHQR